MFGSVGTSRETYNSSLILLTLSVTERVLRCDVSGIIVLRQRRYQTGAQWTQRQSKLFSLAEVTLQNTLRLV